MQIFTNPATILKQNKDMAVKKQMVKKKRQKSNAHISTVDLKEVFNAYAY